ncbi:MAG TPA: hypothetical protein PLA94_28720, partial [Myxococcota bacterium]|nr:hypothetical protein [Myxococcota bacterium]
MVDRLPLIRLVEHMFSPEELSTLLSGFGGNGFVNHLPSPHPFHVYVHQVIERVEQLNLQVGFVRWLLKQRPTRVAEICLVAFRCFPGDDVDDLVRQVFSPSILATKNRPTSSYRVVVYWHINSDFGAVAAERYAAILQAAGLQ